MFYENNVIIGIQCRLRSKRLPAKALLKLNADSILAFLTKRALNTNLPVYILTSDDKSDDLIVNESKKYSISGIIRGSENDVISRYFELQKRTNANIIVRVTADNPLTDFRFIPILTEYLVENKLNFSTIDNNFCIEGSNIEIFTKNILKQSFFNDQTLENKENVTTYMKKKSPENYQLRTFLQTESFIPNTITKYSVTIDTIDDYIKVKELLFSALDDFDQTLDVDIIDKCLNLIRSNKNAFPIGRNHRL
tara:strand:- start:1050 stop:1802 length:753 start_codon:yes stop_codon:yes gene_type:complete